MGVTSGPAEQLTPPPPSNLRSRLTGTRNGSSCCLCGGLSTAGGARGRADGSPAHVAGPRPGRVSAAGAGPPGRREVARSWPGARGRTGCTRPERPLSRHTWTCTWLARPAARALALPPTGTPGNPGGLARRPHPAALTSRGLALPALATAPRPSGAGRGPAQDTPPAAAASARGGAPAGSLHPARPRACVTEGWSLAPSSPVSRKPRPQRPSSAKSRLPQTNTQWHPAWLGRPRPSGRAAGGPAAARQRGSERAASPRCRAAALARREPGLLASRHAPRGSLRDLGRASAPCASVSASEVGMGAVALALQSPT